MNIRTALFVTTSLLGALALAACDSGTDGAGGSGGTGGSTTTTTTTGTAGGGGMAAADGWVRLVHMSPDTAGGVDFCLTGADGMARTSGYAATGITYPGAGEYVTLPADTYQIKVVAAGQACDAMSLGDIADYPVAAGSYHAVIVDGLSGNASLAVGAVTEDNVPTTAGMVFLNAFHENSGAPPVQIGTVDANDVFTSLFGDGVTLAYQEYTSAEIAPVTMGTILAVSTDGVAVDGRWTIPADLATGGASVFITGTDATDIGAFACINLANTCLPLATAN